MSKRHFLLYDFLLPIAGILGAGYFFSTQFDTDLFRWLDSLTAFGVGPWFRHSPARETLWNHSYLIFAAGPALLWLLWVKMNLEYDYIERGRTLDRPIYNFVRGCFRWVDGTDASKWQLQSAQFRAAQAEDHARKLAGELARLRKDYQALEADYDALEEETASLEVLEDEFHPKVPVQAR